MATPEKSMPEFEGVSTETGLADRMRRIKSYVMRSGRVTEGQRRAFETLGPTFLLPYTERPIDWPKVFGRDYHPKILEIGFGMGETTAHIAQVRPSDDFLAIEVHEPGVGALLKRIGENQITNLRLIRHDAVEVIDHMIPDNYLDGVHIFFPDPWHKKRHHKRRLIQPQFVEKLSSKIKSGGYIHLATDWQEYAEQMMAVLGAEESIKNMGSLEGGYSQRPEYRPITKFENRGLRLGHGVWDLVFKKR
jgi:tRNA (guanine-N7-)-methyltransferase